MQQATRGSKNETQLGIGADAAGTTDAGSAVDVRFLALAAAAVWQLPSCPVGRLVVVSSISMDLLPLVALLPGSAAAPAQILDTLWQTLLWVCLSRCARAAMCHKNVASCVSQKTRTICCMLLQVICSCSADVVAGWHC